MSNLVSLRGEALRSPGEVNPEVVALAEELLELARSGEIHSLIAIFVHADESVGSLQRGMSSYRLIGMMTKTIHDICASME
jgi:hypothetical protein